MKGVDVGIDWMWIGEKRKERKMAIDFPTWMRYYTTRKLHTCLSPKEKGKSV